MMINKDLKTFKKRDSSLEQSAVDMRGNPLQCGMVGSQLFSWDRDNNSIVRKEGLKHVA